MARPPGATNKLRPSVIEDILKERGVNLVHKALDLLASSDEKIQVQVVKLLMEYQYAKRRPEDAMGNPDEAILQPVILSPEAALELLKAAKSK